MKIAVIKVATVPFALLFLVLLFEGSARQQQLPEGEGKEVFINKCGECHAFKTIDELKKVPEIDVKMLDEKKGWIAF